MNGKAALITGASRGIGRAVALRLASEGAAIYLAADGTEAELEETAAACRKAGAPDAAWGVYDLARAEEPESMVAAAHQRMGRIDILVNNAGIRVRKAFGEFSHEEFDRLVAVNLRAPFFASQAVVPIMRAQGGGHVIHMASQLGIVASRYGAVYNLTKAGLIQLTRSMALELSADGISVNAVCPGPVSTEGFVAGRNPGELEQRARRSDRPLRHRRRSRRRGCVSGLEGRRLRDRPRARDGRRLHHPLGFCRTCVRQNPKMKSTKEWSDEKDAMQVTFVPVRP